MSTDERPQRIRRFDDEWNDAVAFSQAVRAGNQLWIDGLGRPEYLIEISAVAVLSRS